MYKVVITNYFKKQLKKLVKKNKNLKSKLKYELLIFDKEKAIPMGMGIFKIRLQSENKGKSGGYRLYLFLMQIEGILTPVCIYSKSYKENLTKAELTKHLANIKSELEKELG